MIGPVLAAALLSENVAALLAPEPLPPRSSAWLDWHHARGQARSWLAGCPGPCDLRLVCLALGLRPRDVRRALGTVEDELRAGQRRERELTCEICGERFTARHPRQTCSVRCLRQLRDRRGLRCSVRG